MAKKVKFSEEHRSALKSGICSKKMAEELSSLGLLQGWTEAPDGTGTCKLALNSKGKVWAEIP